MSDAAARMDEDGLRVPALIAYGLYLIAPLNGATAIAGVILAYIKRGEARGTVWESHYRNLIRVFWISLIVLAIAFGIVIEAFGGMIFTLVTTDGNPPPAMVGSLFLFLPALWMGGLFLTVWYYYRTVRGFIRAIDGKAY
ncbi:MAG: hypothetical protein JSR60_14350 [Proteobacteria bacterium]|nr:hypothetical protein [Pseudomonadota bacterium]